MKRVLIIPLIVFSFSLSYLSAYCQTSVIVSKLTAYSSIHVPEKVYLHFDKPYYATGDTIYFKAYVTLGERHQLSRLSGILHVDLINIANNIDQAIKLQLVNGVAWGDFALPDSIPPGNYRIRAYTQWMRNDGNYFEQTFPIGSLHNLKIPESSTAKTAIGKPDLQFFPEGGSLVMDIRSKIAFKSIGSNGLGLDARGTITDYSGKVISEFATAHLGMGYFYLEPKEGETYKANITYADGSKNIIDLPVAESKGIVLNINNDSIPNASVRIDANRACYNENKGREYSLLIYSGGISTNVAFKLDSQSVKMDIIKRHLYTGVTQITLFSPTGEPLSERLLFIQNYDHLYLNVSSDKTMYAARGKVNVKLNAKTRTDSTVTGHFSISVIDESKVPVNENTESTILTNLLLTSDLKGNVEEPNYYFTNITDETNKNLDLVMLTHGYRRFDWKQVLKNENPPLAYQPERSLEVRGMAKNVFGKPVANGTVSLISLTGGPLVSQNTNDKGIFRFSPLAFTDTMQFVLQAVNAKGKTVTELVYNEEPGPEVKISRPAYAQDMAPVMFAYLQNSEKQQEELNKAGLGKGRTLKEVKIREIKLDNKYETESLAGAGFADQVIHNKDFGNTLSLPDALSGKLMGIRFTSSGEPGGGGVPVWFGAARGGSMLVVVDGLELPPTRSNIDYLRANDVETVEVLKFGNAAIYGFRGSNGVLVITRKKGKMKDLKDIPSFGVLPITVQGYQKVREFYSPKYENNTAYSHPDLRSTIYWQPELITDKDGNASFEYYNADGKGTYRVVVEGVDEKGHIGRQVYRYKVD